MKSLSHYYFIIFCTIFFNILPTVQSMDGNNGINGLLEQVNLAFGLLSGAITLFNFVQGTVL